MLKRRLVQADYVVDITAIDDLHELGKSDESFRIGAAVPYVDIVQHPSLDRKSPVSQKLSRRLATTRSAVVERSLGALHADPQEIHRSLRRHSMRSFTSLVSTGLERSPLRSSTLVYSKPI
ncbi:hypothetical protein D8S78_22710 [Natrialba swarupiae]|nr:hypothetical protein [Natrialba swarupiae]